MSTISSSIHELFHKDKVSCQDINQCGYLTNSFAISQVWKCRDNVIKNVNPRVTLLPNHLRVWKECDYTVIKGDALEKELSVMGYSLRSREYRYTAWVPFDRVNMIPLWNQPLVAEELYDHRDEKLGDDYVYELENKAPFSRYKRTLRSYREKLYNFLKDNILYKQRNKQKFVFTGPGVGAPADSSTEVADVGVGNRVRSGKKQQKNIWNKISHSEDGMNVIIESKPASSNEAKQVASS